jgi:hypothetical protein
MVEFGKSFSDGKSIDTIETDKSRIILHELEAGWWLLAVRYQIHEFTRWLTSCAVYRFD